MAVAVVVAVGVAVVVVVVVAVGVAVAVVVVVAVVVAVGVVVVVVVAVGVVMNTNIGSSAGACLRRLVKHLSRDRTCKCKITEDAELVPDKDCEDGLFLKLEYEIAKKRMQEMRGE